MLVQTVTDILYHDFTSITEIFSLCTDLKCILRVSPFGILSNTWLTFILVTLLVELFESTETTSLT